MSRTPTRPPIAGESISRSLVRSSTSVTSTTTAPSSAGWPMAGRGLAVGRAVGLAGVVGLAAGHRGRRRLTGRRGSRRRPWHLRMRSLRRPPAGRPARANVSPASEHPDDPGDRVDQDGRDDRQGDGDRPVGQPVGRLEQPDLPEEATRAAGGLGSSDDVDRRRLEPRCFLATSILLGFPVCRQGYAPAGRPPSLYRRR